MPCRSVRLRQGAERENDRPSGSFPMPGAKCQYENVRALFVICVTKKPANAAQSARLEAHRSTSLFQLASILTIKSFAHLQHLEQRELLRSTPLHVTQERLWNALLRLRFFLLSQHWNPSPIRFPMILARVGSLARSVQTTHRGP